MLDDAVVFDLYSVDCFDKTAVLFNARIYIYIYIYS